MSLLTLVATPIGNREDFSPRARRELSESDVVYAEDTRHSGRLLKHFGIEARLRSCHDHNERDRAAEIVEHLSEGRRVALISDAGTPGLADPGFRVVRAAVEAGFRVSMIPGPTSVVMALVLSGFATDRFVFEGWMPRRSGGLRDRIRSWADETRTVVALESAHRLRKSLPVFAEELSERRMAICRELTKLHEEVVRGLPHELAARFEDRTPKGEIVIVVEGAST